MLGDEHTSWHGDNWSFNTNVSQPTQSDIVFEDHQQDGECFLGHYRFDDDVAALATLAADLVTNFIETQKADQIEGDIIRNLDLSPTERESLILARLGQGLFRSRVTMTESECRVTGVSDARLLIASHMKPWSQCQTTDERLDGNNGLLLTPTVDRLFDRGFLTFQNDGHPIWSDHIPQEQVNLLNLPKCDPRKFNKRQQIYLNYHRKNVFRA